MPRRPSVREVWREARSAAKPVEAHSRTCEAWRPGRGLAARELRAARRHGTACCRESDLRDVLLGSTAERVIRRAETSILVVAESSTSRPSATRISWRSGRTAAPASPTCFSAASPRPRSARRGATSSWRVPPERRSRCR